MKIIKKTLMESFEGDTLAEFTERFNKTLSRISNTADKYDKPVVDLELLRGYVMYESTERIPESIKDKLMVAGQTPKCPECKYYEATDFVNGNCPFVRGRLRIDDDVCNKFFEAWEHGDPWFKEGGERYERYLKEHRD